MIEFFNTHFGILSPLVFMIMVLFVAVGIPVIIVHQLTPLLTFLRRYSRPIAAYALVLVTCIGAITIGWRMTPSTKIIEKPVTIYVDNPGTNQYVISMVVEGDNQRVLKMQQMTAHNGEEVLGSMYSEMAKKHPGYKTTMYVIQQK